ncbi:hypothetical protein GCM10007874_17730 [Labrys miyagiensis]|uniref:Uncharacterized protein n=1 Tax=Labrys miyagiensis TaxID=346912 RepID=A0ABQ6CKK7_9HYPH|nr:hypothetical protein [Labrys miyagiensis]GLS18756.1 hypothetical protein GCM10007874_17730 [Labrys miyagiensis]
MPGGYRPGAGRPKGSLNKSTLEKGRAIGELAKEFTEEAIQTLVAIMRDPTATAPARVSAADKILERGWGKAIAQVEIGRPGDFSHLSDEELERRILEGARELGISAVEDEPVVDEMILVGSSKAH